MAQIAVVGMSMRAYARSRAERGLTGGTLRAVQKAAERGRLVRYADGSVDAAASDVAWEAEMDPRAAMKRATAGIAHAEVARAAGETMRAGGETMRAGGETVVEWGLVQGELAAAGPPAGSDVLRGEGKEESESAKLTRYRAELERLKAEEARERRSLRSGQLLDAAEVMAAQVTVAAEVRTFFMNFVNDVSPDLAAALGVDERRVWIELSRVMKAALAKQTKAIEGGIAA